MFGYTGNYKGKKVSVQGTGMGMPSCAIYSYELIHFFGCKNLIRIGTAGALLDKLKIGDLLIGMGACTDSNFASQYELDGTFAPIASYELLKKAVDKAEKMNINYHVGNILSSDAFYKANNSTLKWAKMGVLAVEMEAAALYMNAAYGKANALCILTISDSLITKEATTPEQREKTFTNMMEVALSLA